MLTIFNDEREQRDDEKPSFVPRPSSWVRFDVCSSRASSPSASTSASWPTVFARPLARWSPTPSSRQASPARARIVTLNEAGFEPWSPRCPMAKQPKRWRPWAISTTGSPPPGWRAANHDRAGRRRRSVTWRGSSRRLAGRGAVRADPDQPAGRRRRQRRRQGRDGPAGGRDLVGAFKRPELVLIARPCSARCRSVSSAPGLAEVLKAGIIGDPALFERLAAGGGRTTKRRRNERRTTSGWDDCRCGAGQGADRRARPV